MPQWEKKRLATRTGEEPNPQQDIRQGRGRQKDRCSFSGVQRGFWISRERIPQCRCTAPGGSTMSRLDLRSGLNAAALAVMVIATALEEFGVPECTDTLEAASLAGPYRWGLSLPNSSRVSLRTKLLLQYVIRSLFCMNKTLFKSDISSCTNRSHHSGFRAIFWESLQIKFIFTSTTERS